MKLFILVLPTISLTLALRIPHLTSGFDSKHQLVARAPPTPEGEPGRVSPHLPIPNPNKGGPAFIDFSHIDVETYVHESPSYPIEEGREDLQNGGQTRISTWKDSEIVQRKDSPDQGPDDGAHDTIREQRTVIIRDDLPVIGSSVATLEAEHPEMREAQYQDGVTSQRDQLREEASKLHTEQGIGKESHGPGSPVTMAFKIPQLEALQLPGFIRGALADLGNRYFSFSVADTMHTRAVAAIERGDGDDYGLFTFGNKWVNLIHVFVDGGDPHTRRSVRPQRLKRQGLLSNIQTAEGNPSSGPTKITNQKVAEFERYLGAFQAAQANVSAILYPFIDTIMANTNSSLVHGAAWSIYADLTASSPFVIGPFFHGLNCLEWFEDKYINSTNGSPSSPNMSDPNIVQMFAINKVLLDFYNSAWSNCSAAVNKTGLLTDMATLSQYLTPSNMSVLPPGFQNYTAPTYDTSYFTKGTTG